MDKIVFTTTSELRELIDNSVRMTILSLQPKEKAKINNPDTQFLSRREAATLLHISMPTLDRRIKEGALKSYLVGNKILLKREELQAVPEERKFTI